MFFYVTLTNFYTREKKLISRLSSSKSRILLMICRILTYKAMYECACFCKEIKISQDFLKKLNGGLAIQMSLLLFLLLRTLILGKAEVTHVHMCGTHFCCCSDLQCSGGRR